MSSITIRKLDPQVKERLRVRAAERCHSMEAEARNIIQLAVAATPVALTAAELFDRIHARFARLGGVELGLPPRELGREPPKFE